MIYCEDYGIKTMADFQYENTNVVVVAKGLGSTALIFDLFM